MLCYITRYLVEKFTTANPIEVNILLSIYVYICCIVRGFVEVLTTANPTEVDIIYIFFFV